MSGVNLVGFVVLLLFLGLLAVFATLGRRWPTVFRSIRGYDALAQAIERAVEAGDRVHVSLGTGSVIGSDSAPAFVGLAMLSRVAAATSMSDKPVVVTTGDGAMSILAQDTLRTAYGRLNANENYQPLAGRMLGPTPYSYVAGLPTLLALEDVSVHMLTGSFGIEGALAVDFARRDNMFILAGTDDAQSQALLYATAEYPLIGEEMFAGGAYLNVNQIHRSSLRTQDVVRILIVAAIIIGTLLRTLGVGI